MSARGPTIVGVLIFFLLLPVSIFAVSVNIITVPSTITVDPFIVTASVSGAASGTNYIRVDLYKEGTSNYFGETFNGNDWCSSGNGKEYQPIVIQSGKFWSGDVQARIGEVNASNYDGQGSYKLRLRRYTSSGSPGSEDADISSVSIAIAMPTATPTVTATSTQTATPTKSPTTTPVSSTVMIQTTPTIYLSEKPTSYVKILSRVTIEDEMASDGAVLGETHGKQNASGSVDVLVQKRPYIVAFLFVGIGLALLAAVSLMKIRYTKNI